jgi:hypothetical protein
MVKPLAYDLSETIRLLNEDRALEMRGLGNRLIKESAFENNYGKAELGVVAYVLHKMQTKGHFIRNPKWRRLKQDVIEGLNSAFMEAKMDNKIAFIAKLKKTINSIENIDNELGNYAQSMLEKARVKQASLAYSYGLSIPTAAQLTGADKKELQNYIGFTTMHDEETESKSIKERVIELKTLIGF